MLVFTVISAKGCINCKSFFISFSIKIRPALVSGIVSKAFSVRLLNCKLSSLGKNNEFPNQSNACSVSNLGRVTDSLLPPNIAKYGIFSNEYTNAKSLPFLIKSPPFPVSITCKSIKIRVLMLFLGLKLKVHFRLFQRLLAYF